jgi:hypothetical protein
MTDGPLGPPTAAQTALFLRKLDPLSPLSEPALRVLIECVRGWRAAHPEIASEHEQFRAAYQEWFPGKPIENWLRVVAAAQPLAKVINRYGEELLPGDGWGN